MKDKSTKRAEANARNAEWSKLTPAQQLNQLDVLGNVATKQRKKLAVKLGK